MFKTIPGKMLAVFISILIIGGLIGIMLNYTASDYLLEEKEQVKELKY